MSEQAKRLVAVTRQPAFSAGVERVMAGLSDVEHLQLTGSLAEARAHCLAHGAPDILLVEVEKSADAGGRSGGACRMLSTPDAAGAAGGAGGCCPVSLVDLGGGG